jgi:hypothetical protein
MSREKPSKTVEPGHTFGAWTILNTTPQSRRANCACKCGAIRQVAFAALVDGSSESCGCASRSKHQIEAMRRERTARRRPPDWRPQR